MNTKQAHTDNPDPGFKLLSKPHQHTTGFVWQGGEGRASLQKSCIISQPLQVFHNPLKVFMRGGNSTDPRKESQECEKVVSDELHFMKAAKCLFVVKQLTQLVLAWPVVAQTCTSGRELWTKV